MNDVNPRTNAMSSLETETSVKVTIDGPKMPPRRYSDRSSRSARSGSSSLTRGGAVLPKSIVVRLVDDVGGHRPWCHYDLKFDCSAETGMATRTRDELRKGYRILMLTVQLCSCSSMIICFSLRTCVSRNRLLRGASHCLVTSGRKLASGLISAICCGAGCVR